ncbi:C39 family peptidase [Candidatus Woesearchaeota archaeon]|nr:C39 family peptidase [Candidatus Woesearchaeota archaeon]
MARPPYCMQEEGDFCGAAVCQMVLSYVGKKYPQMELAKRIGILDKRASEGTGYASKQNIRRLFEEEGVAFEEFAGRGTVVKHGDVQILKDPLEKLVSELGQGNIAIANTSSRGGHYVLVYGVDGEEVFYHDPGIRSDRKTEVSKFQERWISGNKDWINWFMVIRNQKAN